MFINHETRETSHGPLKTCILHRESDIERRETSDKRLLNMQNKPNLKNAEMIVSACNIRCYGILCSFCRRKNKAKQSQNKANFSLLLALFLTNKPNFKPNSVKIGKLRPLARFRSVFRFYSVFCVLCPVSSFVTSNWLCFLPGIAIKCLTQKNCFSVTSLAKIYLKALWLKLWKNMRRIKISLL